MKLTKNFFFKYDVVIQNSVFTKFITAGRFLLSNGIFVCKSNGIKLK